MREAPRCLEDSDKRGQLTGVFGMHGAEDYASWSKKKREAETEKEQQGEM